MTWTGTTNNTWDTGTNWSGGSAPGSTHIATFANPVSNTSPTLAAATTYTVAGINVTGGSAISLGGGNSSTHLQIGTGGIANSNGSTAFNIGNSGDLLTAASNTALTLSGTGTNGTISTVIANNGTTSITKSGTGSWLLSGANTYTGPTRIDAGTLYVSTLANGGSASGIGASSSAASNLVIGDGGLINAVLIYNGSGSTTDRLFTVGTYGGSIRNDGTGALNFTNTGAIAFAGSGARSFYLRGSNTGNNIFAPNISDDTGGATHVTKSGAGTWTLSGANTYTGATTLTDGILKVTSLANGGANSNIGASSNAAANLVLANSSTNATLQYIGSGNASTDRLLTIGSGGAIVDSSGTGTLSFTNTGSIAFSNSGARTFYLQGTNTGANTFAPVIGDNGGSTGVTKFGAGQWVLTGANTYTGATTLYAGTVTTASLANGGSASNLGASTNAASNLVFRGGTLQYTGSGVSTDRLFSLGSGDGIIAASGTGALNFTNTGALGFNSQSGTRTLYLEGTNTGANTLAALIADNGSDAVGLTKYGTGSWTLTGTNTYTGITKIDAGTLAVSSLANGGSASNIGAASSAASNFLFRGGTLQYTGGAVSTDRLFSVGISGGTLDASGSGALNFTNTGAIGFNSQNGARSLTLTGTNTGANTLAAVLGDNNGATSLTKSGAGTWVLSGANTYTGATTISSGTLRLGTSGVLSDSSAVSVSSGATFDVNGKTETIGSLAGAGNVTLGAGTLTAGADNTSTTFSGVASGSGAVTKSGTGTLTLSGANTYTGTTTVSAGTLRLGANGVVSDYSAVSVSSGATFDVNGKTETIGSLAGAGDVTLGAGALTTGEDNSSTTFSGVASGSGSLTKSGTGTLTLSGANTYTGATTVSAGTLKLGANSSIADSSAVTVSSGATLDVNGRTETVGSLAGTGNVSLGTGTLTAGSANTDTTFSGLISGTGSLTKEGTGTLNLSGANTYTGTTNINAGTLRLGASGVLADTTAVVLTGGTLDLANHSETVGSITGSGNITLGTGTLTTGGTNSSASLTATLSGTGGLIKNGTGDLTLLANNTYTGTTTINAGNLYLGNGGTAGSVAGDIVNNGSALNLRINRSDDFTYAGAISGTGGLQKSGSGTVTLSGANTYSGATYLAAGTLRLGAANALANTTAVSLGGGTLDINGYNAAVGSITGSSNITLGSGSLSVGAVNTDTTFDGVISGTGSFTKIGTGTLYLSGANTYTGATTISAGTLTTTNYNVLSDSTAVTVASGATYKPVFGDRIGSLAGAGDVVLNGSLLHGGDNTSTTFSGVLSNGGYFVKEGAGTLTLSGTNTATGVFAINGGTLSISSLPDAGGSSNLGTGNNGNASLSLAGGTLRYTGAAVSTDRLFSVGTAGGTIDASGTGALNLTNTSAIGFTAFDNSGSPQSASYAAQSGARTLTLSGTNTDANTLAALIGDNGGATSLTKTGAGTWVLSGANTYTGTTTISGGTLRLGENALPLEANRAIPDSSAVTIGSSGTLDVNGKTEAIGSLAGSGSVTLGTGGYLYIGVAGTDTTFSGVVSGDGGIEKRGGGTLTLSGVNTYTGETVINEGTLKLAAGNSLATSSVVNVGATTSAGTLDLNGTAQTISQLNGNGSVVLGTGTLTLSSNSGSDFLGTISGAGSLVHNTTTTSTLQGANTYTGGTTVNAGTLAITNTGSLASTGAVTVNGGSLSFANTAGQTIASLAGTGGSVNLASGVALTVNQTGNTGYDGAITGSGSLVKSGANTLTLTGVNTYTGSTTVTAGTLDVYTSGSLASTGSVTVNGGTLGFYNTAGQTIASLSGSAGSVNLASGVTLNVNQSGDTTYAGVIAGAGALQKSASGTLTLTNANTYTGATTISGGALNIQNATALGTTAAGTTVASGAALQLQGGITVGSEALTLSGTGVSADGALRNISGANTYGGLVTLDTPTRINTDAGSLALSHTGTITGSGHGLTVGGAGDTTIAGIIGTGTGGLTKEGAGTLTLTGASTYTGATTINGGTLSVSSLANGGSASNLGASTNAATNLVLDGGTLRYTGPSGVFTDRQFTLGTSGGTLDSASATGALYLSNTNAVTLLGTGARTLTLTGINTSSNNALFAPLGDNGGATSLTKSGSGTWYLLGSNTYTGGTTVSAGTLLLGNNSALPSNGAVTIANEATLNANSRSMTIGALGGSGSITNHNSTLTVGGDNSSSTFSGVISGTYGSLTKNGTGALTLSGSNTYGSSYANGTATIINSGSLIFGASGVLPSNTQVYLSPGATLDLAGYSGTIGGLSDTSGSGGTVSLGSGTLTISNSQGLTFTGVISGTGTVTTSGTGYQFLYGTANSYTGPTTLSGSATLYARHLANGGTASSIGASSASAANLVLDGGRLYWSDTASTAQSTDRLFTLTPNGGAIYAYVGSGSHAANFTNTGTIALSGNGARTLTLAGANVANTFAPTLTDDTQGNASSLVISSGYWNLSGQHTYTGATTINSGGIFLGADNVLPNSSALAQNGVLILNGHSAAVGSISGTNSSAYVDLNNGALTVGANNASTSYAGYFYGSNASLTKVGAGTLTLPNLNAFNGGNWTFQINGGLVNFAATTFSNTGGITLNGGGLQWASGNTADISSRLNALGASGGTFDTNGNNVTFASALTGSGGITKSGTGTLTLSAANTFAGATTLAGGALRITTDNQLGAAPGSATAGHLSFNGGTLQTGASLTLHTNRGLALGASGGTLAPDAGTTLTAGGAIAGSGGLSLTGAGTVALAGASTYSGNTTLTTGTLEVQSATALGTGALRLSGGSLQAGGSAQSLSNPVSLLADSTIGGSQALTLSGAVTLNGFKSLTVANTATTTLSGSIGQSSPSILIKQGGGELVLTGASTYTGGTYIDAGTVRINNLSGSAFGTGAVTVAPGATLAGAGSFTGALQLNGTFSPGNSPGTTGTGSQTWGGGGGYYWEINNATGIAGTNWDLLSISGTLAITATTGSPFSVSLHSLTTGNAAGQVINFNSAQNYSYTIASASGGITGFSADKFSIDTTGFQNAAAGTWSLAQSGGDLNLVYSASAIPEPSTYAALGGLTALAVALWRRRRAPALTQAARATQRA